MAGRKVVDEVEAVSLLEEARRRGVKPSAVAHEQGVDGRSIHAWSMALSRRGKTRRRTAPADASTFLELMPLAPMDAPNRLYRVWVGEVRLDLDDSFDKDTLRRLISVLRTC